MLETAKQDFANFKANYDEEITSIKEKEQELQKEVASTKELMIEPVFKTQEDKEAYQIANKVSLDFKTKKIEKA